MYQYFQFRFPIRYQGSLKLAVIRTADRNENLLVDDDGVTRTQKIFPYQKVAKAAKIVL